MSTNKSSSQLIRSTTESGEHVDIPLKTSEKILARITDGIYRQPASALRELISNAYDADATEVTIRTDAPRFAEISLKDNGMGISPEMLEHLIENIGGSAKRTETGKQLNMTSENTSCSPKGRKFIGKMGIGLFAVVQFTRHFLIITKCKGDNFRTIADVTLGETKSVANVAGEEEIIKGEARVWTERATDDSHGTEVKLLDLLPRTRAELCTLDRWSRIDFEIKEDGKAQTASPKFHIGRMDTDNPDTLKLQPNLPWNEKDKPEVCFKKFVDAVRQLAKTERELVDLELVCDNYLQTIWELSLASPLNYVEQHPFDLPKDESTLFFQLENKSTGQASELNLSDQQTPREKLNLKTPLHPASDRFCVTIDGIQLSRPIIFSDQPKTENAIKTPLMFIGGYRENFDNKPVSMSGGPLEFEAYLFWTPRVLPKQHQGVMLRVGNASGAPFDRTFMDYQVSEQTRLRQLTIEVFVHEGLDGAINLDRESYNFAHPHYQYLVKWLHSAIRQFANKHKAVGKALRDSRKEKSKKNTKDSITQSVVTKLAAVGVDDLVNVEFINESLFDSAQLKRKEGIVAFNQASIFSNQASQSANGVEQTSVNQKKAEALTQLLYGWGLLDELSHVQQAQLVRDILEVVLTKDGL